MPVSNTPEKFRVGGNDHRVIEELFRLGHFHSPKNMTSITKDDLAKLKLTDKDVRGALISFQDIMAYDLNRLTAEAKGRTGIIDGEFGPITAELFNVPRCGEPDYLVEASVAEAGRGSWPVGCHPEWPNDHAFAIFFNKSGMPSFWQPVFDQCFLLVRQAYADIGIVFFEVKEQNRANTVVTWQRGAGWIGLAIVPSNPGCRDRIWARFDNRYRPSDLVNQLSRLLAHEWCHNMGLSHTRGGIMNPSIVTGPFTPRAWRGDPSEAALVRFFGGIPVDIGGTPKPPDEPEPPCPPDQPEPPAGPEPPKGPNEFWFSGDFQLMQGDKLLGSFILTPKPKV